MKLFLVAGCIACCFAIACGGEPIRNAAQAIARADAITGLQAVSGASIATRVTLLQDHTPFLGERNLGKPVWQVEYPKGSTRAFSAVLDPADGHLLFLTSGSVDIRLSGGAAAEQLRAEGEVYTGYPDRNPAVNLVAALKRVPVAQAAAIEAIYVLHSRRGSKPREVWILTLRGLPPIPAHGPHADVVPASKRNQFRYVVDATTGQVLFSTNSPQP